MKMNNAAVVIDGEYRGLVGYIQGYDYGDDWVHLKLFKVDSHPIEVQLPIEDIVNLDEKFKMSVNS